MARRAPVMKVAFFGFDLAEASHIRTVRAMQATGAEVESFTFRRANMNRDFHPDWTDHPLGLTANGAGLRRGMAMLRALWRLARLRQQVRSADIIVARGADMTLLALFARLMAARRVPMVYQCLDIHAHFTAPGWRGRLARWVERRVLARCLRLVVSSPGFLRHYFGPMQGWTGESLLVENKIFWDQPAPRIVPRPNEGPLRIGWIGTLRCAKSLHLLEAAAKALGPEDVEIVLRGVVHPHLRAAIDAACARHKNMVLHGAYAYPDGLAGAYGELDLIWAQDLWQTGANSDWLLPNRIYEAAYFACPVLAVAGTETARKVAADGLGFVLERADEAALIARLRSLRRADITTLHARLIARDGRAYCLSARDMATMLALPAARPRATPARITTDAA